MNNSSENNNLKEKDNLVKVSPTRNYRLSTFVLAVIPFILLGAFVAFLLLQDPRNVAGTEFPPVEKIIFERIVIQNESETQPHLFLVDIRNDGPDPVTIAQVMVDEAYWYFTMTPEDKVLGRLQSGTIEIPYHWVEGEAYHITLLTETGVTFNHEIPVAVESPPLSVQYFSFFALIGFYVGIVPIMIGLAWYPTLRRLTVSSWNFILFFTVGLLVFLGAETVVEGIEMSGGKMVAETFHPAVLFFILVISTFLLLQVFTQRGRNSSGTQSESRGGITLAYMVALGIGLHNLGEGLAIGTAYSTGELTLGATLVIGFALHNTTEGLAIISPLARQSLNLKRLIKHLTLLGVVAGVPTIVGAWIGGFAPSTFWGIIFMAIGAGAIFQVVYSITFQIFSRTENPKYLFNFINFAGLMLGFGVMFGTALLV